LARLGAKLGQAGSKTSPGWEQNLARLGAKRCHATFCPGILLNLYNEEKKKYKEESINGKIRKGKKDKYFNYSFINVNFQLNHFI